MPKVITSILVPVLFILFINTGLCQEAATLKPSPVLTDKKKEKKAAKAEHKIQEQSQKDMDSQVGEFHKKHYKKRFKNKPPQKDKGL